MNHHVLVCYNLKFTENLAVKGSTQVDVGEKYRDNRECQKDSCIQLKQNGVKRRIFKKLELIVTTEDSKTDASDDSS